MFLKCWKYPSLSVMYAFTLFLVFDATRWRVSVSQKRFTRRDIVDLFGTGESGNVFLNSFWQVRTRCQVVFDNEHSLHLWKRYPCTSTVWKTTDGLARAGCNMTWPAWTLVSHSDIVCLLIQSNCIELQPSINVLIWVAWLFDHSTTQHSYYDLDIRSYLRLRNMTSYYIL
jgi:hypothetical protein